MPQLTCTKNEKKDLAFWRNQNRNVFPCHGCFFAKLYKMNIGEHLKKHLNWMHFRSKTIGVVAFLEQKRRA